jgi:hypothetical protein
MKTLLFLDDERNIQNVFWVDYPKDISNYVIVRNYDQFVQFIEEKGIPDYISFDNDLGEPKEGYDCVK